MSTEKVLQDVYFAKDGDPSAELANQIVKRWVEPLVADMDTPQAGTMKPSLKGSVEMERQLLVRGRARRVLITVEVETIGGAVN